MKRHIIDFHWYKQTPYLVYRILGSKKVIKDKLLGIKFNFRMSKKRLCPGAYSLLEWKYSPCEQEVDLTGSKYERCRKCEDKIGFKNAFFFGEESVDGEVGKYLSQPHLLYLAFFAPGIIKVGTTSEQRGIDRLYEQDAQVFSYIAEASGRDIDSIERFVSDNFKIREHVQLQNKIKNLSLGVDQNEAERKIQDVFEKIKKGLNGTEFEDWLYPSIEVQYLERVGDVKNLHDIEFLNEYDEIGGTILSVRGRLILFENDKSVFAIDGKKLIGQVLEDSDTDIKMAKKNTQRSLFSQGSIH